MFWFHSHLIVQGPIASNFGTSTQLNQTSIFHLNVHLAQGNSRCANKCQRSRIRWWRITYLVQVTRSVLVYLFFFLTSIFCSEHISKLTSPINMNFSMVIDHLLKFIIKQDYSHQSTVTSSRRHFVIFRYDHVIDHIFKI